MHRRQLSSSLPKGMVRAGGVYCLGIGCSGNQLYPQQYAPDGWRQMTSTSAILMVSGKGGALTIFFFFFFGKSLLFSTSFSIVYSANGQISLNPVGTEQLEELLHHRNTQSPYKTSYPNSGFQRFLQKHSSHE